MLLIISPIFCIYWVHTVCTDHENNKAEMNLSKAMIMTADMAHEQCMSYLQVGTEFQVRLL